MLGMVSEIGVTKLHLVLAYTLITNTSTYVPLSPSSFDRSRGQTRCGLGTRLALWLQGSKGKLKT